MQRSHNVSDTLYTSINPVSDLIACYPNPTSAFITVVAPYPVDLRLFSVDGRLLLSAISATQIQLELLHNEIYFLVVSDKFGSVKLVEKVVKMD